MILLSLLFVFLSFSQQVPDTLYVFDAVDSTYSIEVFEFDTSEPDSLQFTDYFIPANKQLAVLETPSVPYDKSDPFFSAHNLINEGDEKLFPLSAVVKMFRPDGDTLRSKCSGMMVSEKHMLTAAHCIYFDQNLFNELYVYAGYHKNGIQYPSELTRAVKYYTVQDVYNGENVLSSDIALLELEHSIGNESGWLGFGYPDSLNSGFLEDRTVYTYGYPADTSLVDSTVFFDGETMVYGFGFTKISNSTDNILEIAKPGIPGQSGSSFFIADQNFGFISLATLSKTTYTHLYAQPLLSDTFSSFKQVIEQTTTALPEEPELAASFRLHQNYPNPFNPSTRISFDLYESQTISLEVFDMMGRRIATIISAQKIASGTHTVAFNAGDLSSGIYIYRLTGDKFTDSKKFTLIK